MGSHRRSRVILWSLHLLISFREKPRTTNGRMFFIRYFGVYASWNVYCKSLRSLLDLMDLLLKKLKFDCFKIRLFWAVVTIRLNQKWDKSDFCNNHHPWNWYLKQIPTKLLKVNWVCLLLGNFNLLCDKIVHLRIERIDLYAVHGLPLSSQHILF